MIIYIFTLVSYTMNIDTINMIPAQTRQTKYLWGYIHISMHIHIIVRVKVLIKPVHNVISYLVYRLINVNIITKNAKVVNPQNMAKVRQAAMRTFSGF